VQGGRKFQKFMDFDLLSQFIGWSVIKLFIRDFQTAAKILIETCQCQHKFFCFVNANIRDFHHPLGWSWPKQRQFDLLQWTE
jgi:hypothetical protein